MPDQPVHKDVHAAILAVMGEVGYVQKQRSQGLNYSYAGEAALIEALRPAMLAHGLSMAVVAMQSIKLDMYETAKGAKQNHTIVMSTVRFTHAPSNTFLDVVAMGEGADTGDKSVNKASTGAYKYALRQTFCIETGDDPDKTPSDDQERARRVAAAQDAAAEAPQRDPDDEPLPHLPPKATAAPAHPPAPPKETLSEAQGKAIYAIGKKLYGDQWPAKKLAILKWATSSDRDDLEVETLTRLQATWIIDELKKQEAASAKPA